MREGPQRSVAGLHGYNRASIYGLVEALVLPTSAIRKLPAFEIAHTRLVLTVAGLEEPPWSHRYLLLASLASLALLGLTMALSVAVRARPAK